MCFDTGGVQNTFILPLVLSDLGNKKLTGKWLGWGRPKEDVGMCAGEALNGIAVVLFIPSLGDLAKAELWMGHWARCCEGTLEMPETWPLLPKSVGQKARHLSHNPTVGFEDLHYRLFGFGTWKCSRGGGGWLGRESPRQRGSGGLSEGSHYLGMFLGTLPSILTVT